MSTGFPHDPFHQIVNVQWLPRLLTFRLRVDADLEHEFGVACDAGPPETAAVTFSYTTDADYKYTGPAQANTRVWNSVSETWNIITSGTVVFSVLPTTPFASIGFGEWEVALETQFLEWLAIPPSFAEVPNIPIPVAGLQALRFRRTTLAECDFEHISGLSSPACYERGGGGFQTGAFDETVAGPFETRQLQLSGIRATYQGRIYRPFAIQRVPDFDLIPPTGHQKYLWVLCRAQGVSS